VPWRIETARLFGQEMPVPRMTAWFGEADYTYSGIHHRAAPFPAIVQLLREGAENISGHQRVIEIMNEVMRSATDEEVRALASFISRLPPPKGIIDVPNTTRIERAKSLVSAYRCDFCHRPDFAGDLNVPRLAGQREDYLIKALRGYKDNSRSGYDASMADVMAPITDEQILDVAYYLARVR
jgi:cytochrome c553